MGPMACRQRPALTDAASESLSRIAPSRADTSRGHDRGRRHRGRLLDVKHSSGGWHDDPVGFERISVSIVASFRGRLIVGRRVFVLSEFPCASKCLRREDPHRRIRFRRCVADTSGGEGLDHPHAAVGGACAERNTRLHLASR